MPHTICYNLAIIHGTMCFKALELQEASLIIGTPLLKAELDTETQTGPINNMHGDILYSVVALSLY